MPFESFRAKAAVKQGQALDPNAAVIARWHQQSPWYQVNWLFSDDHRPNGLKGSRHQLSVMPRLQVPATALLPRVLQTLLRQKLLPATAQ